MHDQPSPDDSEITEIKKEISGTGPARGARRWICLALIAIGLGLVIVGLVDSVPTVIRVSAIVLGVSLMAAFGFGLLGASRIGGTRKIPGAQLTQDYSEKITITKKRGFPRRGRNPLDPPNH
jgi:hypothetical protein